MLKVYSSCVMLTTLVFSSAHAPTFQLWQHLPTASAETAPLRVIDHAGAAVDPFADRSYALNREYDEGNDLERFELDELHLPKLNVDLPELFDWSDGEREYLASNTLPVATNFGLDNPNAYALRTARASVGFGGGGIGHSGGGSARSSKASDTSVTDSSASDATSQSTKSAADGIESNEPSPEPTPPESLIDPVPDLIESILPPNDDEPDSYVSIVEEQQPVQVPAPGPFGLFVLGLAALRLVGRKKNGSG